MAKRVQIVGAGPGGLAAAMLLASAGVEVDVYERASDVGGRTSVFDGGGCRFDLGPTFFLYPRTLEDIFEQAGYDLRSEVELVKLDPQYRLVFGDGGELNASCDVDRLTQAIAQLSPDDATRVKQFFIENQRKFSQIQPCLQRPFHSWRDLFSAELMQALPVLRPWNSLDRELKRYFHDPRIRLAFGFQSKYLGMSPFQCPSLFSILSFLEYEFGVYHPIGGCGQVMKTMARIAIELGARIHLEEPVEQILFDGKKAVGVRTHQGEHRSDAVVVNADFAQAISRLVPDRLRRRWSNARIAQKDFSCSTFMMYLGLDIEHANLAHHTIYLASDYERNLADIASSHRLSESPSFYVQNACVTDPTLAPRGMSTLYVLVPVTHMHENVDWGKERERFRELTLDRLRLIGLGDVRRHISYERIVTPADWKNEFAVYRGATFNLAHTMRQMLHLRPHNRFEDTEGIYLVGGGTHPGSGLPVIFESARITSKLVLGDLDVAAKDSRGRKARPIGRPESSDAESLVGALDNSYRDRLVRSS